MSARIDINNYLVSNDDDLATTSSHANEQALTRAKDTIKPKFSSTVEIKRFPSSVKRNDNASWICTHCTLLNNHSQICCSACNQQRGGHPPKINCNQNRAYASSALNKAPQRQTSESMDLIRLVEKSEAAEQFMQIVAYCKVNKQSFVDDSFPPNDSSMGNFKLNLPGHTVDDANYVDYCKRHIFPITWRRPFQIVFNNNNHRMAAASLWTVYSDPKPTDIIQGYLGNCWFLSALAVLAERRDLLEHAVITKQLNAEGVYQIRLCVDGRWRVVLVDDYFPCDKYYRMIFSRAERRQLWVPLIEKALAKLHGSYAALSTGRTVEGLAVLTGAPCITVSLEFDDSSPDQPPDLNLLWAKLLSAKEAGYIMGTSCGAGSRPVNNDEYAQMGLHPRHAYSLLNLKDLQGIRLVQLRNPWGHGEWKGAWSRGSDLWKDGAVAQAFSGTTSETRVETSGSGLFWMPFEELCRFFDSVDICKLRPNCKEVRVVVPLPKDCRPNNVNCVFFHVDETTEVDFVLHQSEIRNKSVKKNDFLDLCILLFNSDVYGNMGSLVAFSDRFMKPFIVLTSVLSRGTYMALCLSFSHWHTSDTQDIPQAVLAAHSCGSLDAQLCPAAPHLLADALIEVLLKHGQPFTETDDAMIYYSHSRKWSGMAIMAENSSATLCLVVTCNCTQSENVISSRASLITCDVILPRRRQLLILLTQLEPTVRYSIRHSVSYVRSVEPFLGRHAPHNVPPMTSHFPPLDPSVRGLHENRPICDR